MHEYIYPVATSLLLVGLAVLKPNRLSGRRFTFFASGFVTIGLVQAIERGYRLWSDYAAGPITQYWLPPHSDLVYAHLLRLAQPLLVNLMTACIIYLLLSGARKYRRLEQYGMDDVYLLTISAFVSGWPGLFITFVAIFIVALVVSIVVALKRKQAGGIRLIITPIILPVTLIIIWILSYLNHVTGLEAISF